MWPFIFVLAASPINWSSSSLIHVNNEALHLCQNYCITFVRDLAR